MDVLQIHIGDQVTEYIYIDLESNRRRHLVVELECWDDWPKVLWNDEW